MKHTFTQRIICLLLMAAMITALCPTFVSAQGETRGFQKPDGRVIVAETDYTIAKGVKETQVILNNSEGTAQVYGYMATIAPNASVKPKASYAGYYTEGSTVTSRAEAAKSLKWDLRTTTGQAADYEKRRDHGCRYRSDACAAPLHRPEGRRHAGRLHGRRSRGSLRRYDGL